MKIVGFGDSFTEAVWDQEAHPGLSYIACLCNLPNSKFNCWENHARGGYSNTQIAFSVYKYIIDNQHKLKDIFVMIAWTTFGRYSPPNIDWRDNRVPYWTHDVYNFGGNPGQYPGSTNLLIHETDIRILGITALLQKCQVPFAMIQAFDDHSGHDFSTIKNLPNWINGNQPSNTLMHIISEKYLNDQFPNLSPNTEHFSFGWFTNIQPNRYITKCWHPNQEGHQLVAGTLYPYLEKFC
jgi:hypothetical protein